ncbi:WD40 repeat domain-containing protein [Chloropicon primus]|uniref:WD40 repeat domain-containing protein n=3 Tax=Chloropicon primus TaxID=1764295 RepID=A0A5B8N102_9CHLO|nr:WD40 repeat domain-containing protein [Chloropicon primus]UPR04802.1 WD40 repeat domain-containing protein [Chloropicon primus]|eukprot:QDZ25605.1 WD40 repeat domain-containing protein [Chloropicon primus]
MADGEEERNGEGEGQGEEGQEEEVFMPEDAEVVADLEGQASESDEEDEDMEAMMLEEDQVPDEVFEVERDDACACLVADSGSGEASGSGAANETASAKPVYAVKWNKTDPSIAACGGEDDRVRLWKPFHAGGPNSITLSAHSDSVVALDFDSSGRLLASGGMDGKVCVWSAITGKLLCSLEGPGEAVEFVKWHPMGRVLLAGSEDMTLWMWNVVVSGEDDQQQHDNLKCEGQCMQVFTGHNSSVTCGGFTPNGKLIVSASLDDTVRVWNPRTGECQHTFSFQNQASAHDDSSMGEDEQRGITCLDFSPDSSMVLCGCIDGAAHLVNVNTNRVLWKLGGSGNAADSMAHSAGQQLPSGHEDSVETVAFHPAGQPLVATGSLDGLLIIWDANTSSPRIVCRHPRGVIRVQWALAAGSSHPPGSAVHDLSIYTCGLDGRVRLWDARSGNCDKEFQGFVKSVLDMDVSPNGVSAIAGSDDGTARVFSS